MPDLPDDFGDRLVAREEVDPMRLEKLREQVVAVLETPLSKPVRWWNGVGGALMVVAPVAMLALVVADKWAEQPFLARVITVVGIGGMILMGLIMIAVARTGVYERRRHNALYICVAGLMCLGLGMALLHNGWATADGQMVFGGAVVLVVGGAFTLMHVLEQYHLSTQRKLLELELRMAEMAERMDRLRDR